MMASISNLAPTAARKWFKKKEPKLCDICRLTFHHGERHKSPKNALRQKVPFDCIRQMHLRTSCRLCRMILQRLGEPLDCHCISPFDACVSLRPTASEHEAEWLIFFEGVEKGSVLRNSD